jgi:hypothetical protein
MPQESNDQAHAKPQTQSDWNNPSAKKHGDAQAGQQTPKSVEPVSTKEGPGAAPEGGTKGGDQAGDGVEQD